MALRLIPIILLLIVAASIPASAQVPIQTARIIRALEQFRVGTDTAKYFTSSTQVIDSASTHRQIPTALSVYEFVTDNALMRDSSEGANIGDILKWDGSSWIPQPDTIGGVGVTYYDTLRDDNVSMTQRGAANFLSTTRISATLTDDPANNETEIELDLSQQGATTGQVLKWDGSAWTPANDSIGAGGGGATDLTFSGASSPVELRSSTGTDVDFIAGTGITLAGTDTTLTITNSAPDQTVSLTEGGIVDITGTYPSFTISATEVDGSVTNEGSLDVAAGGANSAAITSNTSGSPSVFIAGGTGIAVTETGDTIVVAATGGGGSGTVKGTGAATQLAYWVGSDSLAGNNNMYWDAVNSRFGLRNSSPAATIHAVGEGSTSATWVGQFHNSTGTSNLLMLRNDNRIGILTSNPNKVLDVRGSAFIGATNGFTGCDFSSTTGMLQIRASDNNPIRLINNGGASTINFLTRLNNIGLVSNDTTIQTYSIIRGEASTDALVIHSESKSILLNQGNSSASSINFGAGGPIGTNINGQNLHIFAGNGYYRSNNAAGTGNGGALFLRGGNGEYSSIGTGSNTNGGNVYIFGGDKYLSGVVGNVIIAHTSSAARGSVGIGSNTPDASAIVDITSTTQGFLPPRMTTAQRDAISTPAAGLIIYNTTTNKHQGYDGTTWNDFY